MIESMSDRFLKTRATAPLATQSMSDNVSEYRRQTLSKEVERGYFREVGSAGPYQTPSKLGNESGPGNVVKSSTPLAKYADLGVGGSGDFRGSGGTVRQVPEIYSPLWLTSNLNLPRDRATINAWCRSFFVLNPIVHNAISLHSTYPISKLSIKCKNQKVQKFFEGMNEEIDLMNVCVQMAQEFFTLGEVFVYAELDSSSAKWSRLLIQNPDYIVVRHSVVAGEPVISLRPDENLRRIVNSKRPSDIQQRRKLDANIIEHVKRGENIPLSNFYASHLARKISPYEIRGTGLPVSCFRQLMLFDLLRESKFAQAYSMINPLTLVKIGSQGADGFKPSTQDLEDWREVFENAQYDKDFKIFTHGDVAVEKIGSNAAILDTTADVQELKKEIYVGLEVPQVLMDGGADVTYANGGVTLDVLRQRYMQFRNMMSSWLRRKIFAPISKINEFYEYVDGEKVLIVPEVEWNHMSLFDTDTYINAISGLVQGEDQKASLQILYKSLGLDWEEEKRKIRDEAIFQAILSKEKLSLEEMSLNELRTLGPGDEIPEIEKEVLPGEEEMGEGGEGMPDMPGMVPEMGGGEMPEMPMEGGGEEMAAPPPGPPPGE